MTVTANIHVGLTAWASGQSVAVGARRSSNSKAYQATTAGTTGATAPSHTSGTVSDGAVSWKWLSAIDFTSYSAWAASIPATPGDAYLGLAWNDGELVTSDQYPVRIDGFTTTSVNTITLRPAPGEGFLDHPTASTNPLRYDATKGVAISMTYGYGNGSVVFTTPNTFLIGFQLKATSQAVQFQHGSVIDSCFVNLGGSGLVFYDGSLARNCVFVVPSNVSVGVRLQQSCILVNCAVVRPSDQTPSGQGIMAQYAGSTVRNCVILGFTTAPSGTITADHNATDSGLGLGTSPIVAPNTTATFVQPNAGSGLDLRTVAGSGLIDAGATDTTNVPSAKSIVGTSRPSGAAWDIGPWEFVGAAAVAARRPLLTVVHR